MILRTVESLADQGVPCLPVHDSIIVPAGDQELAAKALIEAFRMTVGVTPHLKIS